MTPDEIKALSEALLATIKAEQAMIEKRRAETKAELEAAKKRAELAKAAHDMMVNSVGNKFNAGGVVSGAVRKSGGLIKKAGSMASGAGAGKLGAILGVAGGVVGAFAAVTAAGFELKDAFLARAKELSKLSGVIAMSEARTEVNSLMADIREANALGDDMARLNDANTDIWIEIRDLLLPMKKFLLGTLADAAEWAKATLERNRDSIVTGLTAIQVVLEATLEFMRLEWTSAKKVLNTMDARIADAIRKANEKKDDSLDFVKKIQDNMKFDIMPGGKVNPGQANQPLGLPAFMPI